MSDNTESQQFFYLNKPFSPRQQPRNCTTLLPWIVKSSHMWFRFVEQSNQRISAEARRAKRGTQNDPKRYVLVGHGDISHKKLIFIYGCDNSPRFTVISRIQGNLPGHKGKKWCTYFARQTTQFSVPEILWTMIYGWSKMKWSIKKGFWNKLPEYLHLSSILPRQ